MNFLNASPNRCWFRMKRIGIIQGRFFLFFALLWCFLCKLVRKWNPSIRRDCQSSPLAICIIPVSSLSWCMNLNIGFAMLCAGAVRRKNVQNTMLKNLLDAVSLVIGEASPCSFLDLIGIFLILVTLDSSAEHQSHSTLLDTHSHSETAVIQMHSSEPEIFS